MVEALAAGRTPVDDLEVAPLVLVVALLAVALGGREAAVEPLAGHQGGAQLLVALQAVGLRELLARLVALRAVGQPLEGRVGAGEGPGGEDVGPGGRGGGQREGRQEGEASGVAHQWSPYPR